MKTAIKTVVLASMLAACGSKQPGNQSLCDGAAANDVCDQTCDPSAGAPITCPTGYHCSPENKCDSQCDASHACTGGSDYTCDFSTGTCNYNPPQGSDNPQPDADCPAVHFTATPTKPSILLLIDKSGSMRDPSGGNDGLSKYQAVQQALTGTTGVVTQLQAGVYFGAKTFAGPTAGCPAFLDVPRALNNKQAIDDLFTNNPPGTKDSTPTSDGVDAARADFVATPPPADSPPVVVLATDGQPNSCTGSSSVQPVVDSIAATYNQVVGTYPHIPVYVLGVGGGSGISTNTLQKFANAGLGVATGQPDAPYYRGTDTAGLATAFQTIINGVVSCDLELSGQVDPTTAQSSGTVTLNGASLTPGTDWTVDANGTTLHILGTACNTLKTSANPDVEATFACGSVVIIN